MYTEFVKKKIQPMKIEHSILVLHIISTVIKNKYIFVSTRGLTRKTKKSVCAKYVHYFYIQFFSWPNNCRSSVIEIKRR